MVNRIPHFSSGHYYLFLYSYSLLQAYVQRGESLVVRQLGVVEDAQAGFGTFAVWTAANNLEVSLVGGYRSIQQLPVEVQDHWCRRVAGEYGFPPFPTSLQSKRLSARETRRFRGPWQQRFAALTTTGDRRYLDGLPWQKKRFNTQYLLDMWSEAQGLASCPGPTPFRASPVDEMQVPWMLPTLVSRQSLTITWGPQRPIASIWSTTAPLGRWWEQALAQATGNETDHRVQQGLFDGEYRFAKVIAWFNGSWLQPATAAACFSMFAVVTLAAPAL